MDTSITISVGTFVAVIGTVITLGFKLKNDIKKDTEQMVNGKISESVAEFKEELNELKVQQTEMHTNIEWIVKMMNGKSK